MYERVWLCERKCMALVRRHCNVCNICIIPEDSGQDSREEEEAGGERGWRFTQSNTNNTRLLFPRAHTSGQPWRHAHARARPNAHQSCHLVLEVVPGGA